MMHLEKNDFLVRIDYRLRKVIDLLFSIDLTILYILTLVLSLIMNGAWMSPQTERLFLISQNIQINPFNSNIGNQWLLFSFLGPTLAFFLHLNDSIFLFCLFHFTFFIFVFYLIIRKVQQKEGDLIARFLIFAFFLSPISNVIFTWLGTPDSYTIILSLLLLIMRDRKVIVFLSSFLLGINHFEQGILILAIISLFHFLTVEKRDRSFFPFILEAILSLFLGRFCLELYFSFNNFNIQYSRFLYIQNVGFLKYLYSTLGNFPALIYSLYNNLIFFIIGILTFYKKREYWVAFIVCSLFAFGVILFTLDQTRVFSIITFPVVYMILSKMNFQSSSMLANQIFVKKAISIIIIISIFTPRIVIWSGNLYGSAYINIFKYLLKIE